MELRVTDLDCTRGGMLVLQGISFTLQAGQALILRGPNGAGKTTLLRVLAGLQPPAAGQIDAPEEAIVYASHLDGLKDMLTVHENLAFWGAVYDRPLGDVMARMNLSALADRPAGTLSAGQRRRLGLARLVVSGRPIWLLDEPTVSLDAESVALFAGVLRDHLSSGGAALIATHIDLGLAAPVMDIGPFRARAIAPAGGFDEAFL